MCQGFVPPGRNNPPANHALHSVRPYCAPICRPDQANRATAGTSASSDGVIFGTHRQSNRAGLRCSGKGRPRSGSRGAQLRFVCPVFPRMVLLRQFRGLPATFFLPEWPAPHPRDVALPGTPTWSPRHPPSGAGWTSRMVSAQPILPRSSEFIHKSPIRGNPRPTPKVYVSRVSVEPTRGFV